VTTPLTTLAMPLLRLDHVPPGVASDSVNVEPIHTPPVAGMIGATTGAAFIVIETFENVAVHGGLEIVQVRTYVVPAVPVNVDVGLVGVVITPPAPDEIVHNPVPTAGAFPASVALPQTDWFVPALAEVGAALIVAVTAVLGVETQDPKVALT
jgi:hypothetical protein